MQKFMPLLFEVWKEACRHIEIRESVERMAPVLTPRLPADLVLVRRLNLERASIDTVATGLCTQASLAQPMRSSCGPDGMDSVLTWWHEGSIIRSDVSELRARLPALLPEGVEGNVLAGPLGGRDEPAGVLILVAFPPRRFDVKHESMVRALLEPFGVALANDRQVRELKKLREAVEADNRSLLSRLGRQDIVDTIVGAETGLRQVMERVELVALSDAPVLILGETGSGKEVVARAIHSRSRRASGPVLRVNCGAVPPELVDSELFGHERGSFTGAVSTRKGWFERADGGTLFLDEIGELPPAAQVRLLRILQDGTFERVGGQRQLRVDVRTVAATNCDLRSEVVRGAFREDLWYRIAVFPIRIPALRERIEDIPALAAHFALRAAKRLGTVPLIPSPEDNDLLVSYDWPGNARELSAVMERAAILGNGRRLEVAKALGIDTQIRRSAAPATDAPLRPAQEAKGFVTLDTAMALHIKAALQQTHGRIEGPEGAAQMLGINPHTLRARMRKLGVDWREFRAGRWSAHFQGK